MPLIEDFEDGNTNGWGAGSVTTDSYEGTYAGVFSSPGTLAGEAYEGRDMAFWAKPVDSNSFGVSSSTVRILYQDSDNYLQVELYNDDNGGEIRLSERQFGNNNSGPEDATGTVWSGYKKVNIEASGGTFSVSVPGLGLSASMSYSGQDGDDFYIDGSQFAYDFIVEPEPLDPVNDLSAAQNGADVDLTWTDQFDQDTARIYRSTSSGFTPSGSNQIATVGGVGSYTDQNPGEGTYYYQIEVESLTDTEGSNEASVTVTIPTTPTLSVDATGQATVDLSWTDENEQSYNVYRAQATGNSVGDYTLVAQPTGTSYQDTGLENGEQFYYRVTSESDGLESDLSNEVSGITTVPATTPSLDASTEDEITVSWTKQDNSSDGEWEIYLSESSGTLGSLVADALAVGATSATLSGLEDGERYWVTLRRLTDHAQADGTQQAATTVLPGPANVSLSPQP